MNYAVSTGDISTEGLKAICKNVSCGKCKLEAQRDRVEGKLKFKVKIGPDALFKGSKKFNCKTGRYVSDKDDPKPNEDDLMTVNRASTEAHERTHVSQILGFINTEVGKIKIGSEGPKGPCISDKNTSTLQTNIKSCERSFLDAVKDAVKNGKAEWEKAYKDAGGKNGPGYWTNTYEIEARRAGCQKAGKKPGF